MILGEYISFDFLLFFLSLFEFNENPTKHKHNGKYLFVVQSVPEIKDRTQNCEEFSILKKGIFKKKKHSFFKKTVFF